MTEFTASLESSPGSSARAAIPRSGVIGLMAFLTVVDLFAAQALLPSLVAHYGVSPAAMGLAVNSCTFGMAASGLAVALFGARIERRTGIVVSLALLALPTAALAFAPNLAVFAALRVVQGIFMASAFGLTLAYLGEHTSASNSATAFAAYITGNVASNLFGRLIAAGVADHISLQAAFYTFALLNLLGAALAFFVIRMTTTAGAFKPVDEKPSADWLNHLKNPEMRAGFAIGFCILFAFIGTFTFVNFVLVAPPHAIGMMGLGVVYLVFLPSIVTTLLAGNLAQKIGSRRALLVGLSIAAFGLPMLLSASFSAVLSGMVLVAIGTFFAQALATAHISQAATSGRAAASGIYLASYFIGGLVGTAVLGQIFDRFGWPATVAGIGAALAAAALLGLRLSQRPQPARS